MNPLPQMKSINTLDNPNIVENNLDDISGQKKAMKADPVLSMFENKVNVEGQSKVIDKNIIPVKNWNDVNQFRQSIHATSKLNQEYPLAENMKLNGGNEKLSKLSGMNQYKSEGTNSIFKLPNKQKNKLKLQTIEKADSPSRTKLMSQLSESSGGKTVNLSPAQEGQLNQISQLMTKPHVQVSSGAVMGTNNAFNMSSLESANTIEIIEKIQDYIQQSKAINKDSVKLKVNHASIGDFDIEVIKNADSTMDVNLANLSSKAKNFFVEHQGRIVDSLGNSGLKISDFRVDGQKGNTNTNSSSDRESSNNSHSQNNNSQNSEKNNQQKESQRRRELWELMQDRNAA